MSVDLSIRPDAAFGLEVEQRSGQPVSLCYQCRRCTTGCPLAFAMDYRPNQVMRMIQLGRQDELLESKAVWVCASCQTCTTRCPNDIDIAHVMDTLRQMSRQKGATPGEPKVVKFHKAFLDSVRRHGRLFELEMVGFYKLATLDFFGDMKIAVEMLKRGKLRFRPSNIQGRREVRQMFDGKNL